MKYNELVISIKPPEHLCGPLSIELFVDEKRLAPQAVVDVFMLAGSVQTSGEFWIFTCSCGNSMCVEIDEPIHVFHTPDAVEWHFPLIDSLGGGDGLDDEQFEQENNCLIFRFDPFYYDLAVSDCLFEAKIAVASAEKITMPCIDHKAEDIQRLSQVLFSSRDCFEDRQLWAKEVVIQATDGMVIRANGVRLSIDQLTLSPELVALFRQFQAKQCFPQQSSELPEYEQYLDAGRKFGCALKRSLGVGQKVKLWYRYGPAGNPDVWSVTEDLK